MYYRITLTHGDTVSSWEQGGPPLELGTHHQPYVGELALLNSGAFGDWPAGLIPETILVEDAEPAKTEARYFNDAP